MRVEKPLKGERTMVLNLKYPAVYKGVWLGEYDTEGEAVMAVLTASYWSNARKQLDAQVEMNLV